jgi:DNA-binding response OmpR family regulator
MKLPPPRGGESAARGGWCNVSQRVLLVEADGLAGVHQVRLASAGYTVGLVSTPAATVGAARSFAPDLVILDVDLFEHDGRDVATRIQAASPAQLLLLVPVSAAPAPSADPAAPRVDFLTKPFTAAALLAGVNQCLRAGAQGEAQASQP